MIWRICQIMLHCLLDFYLEEETGVKQRWFLKLLIKVNCICIVPAAPLRKFKFFIINKKRPH